MSAGRRPDVLVVYSAYPTRATVHDALYSFRRYADAQVHYLNVRLRRAPAYLRSVPFDLVIFQTSFFSNRFDARFLERTFERAAPLAALKAVKVMLPQDEFINTDAVNRFIADFGIDAVFSVMPPDQWPAIYGGVPEHVRIHQVLTGYLDDARVRAIEHIRAREPERPVDIGYRTAGSPPPWFGRHGYLKRQIADVFLERAPRRGLELDISTSASDVLLGNDWYRALCRWKYTLGVEGGTSILDHDGSIRERTERYQAEHPDASFEEVEAACFPGLDGTFRGSSISPRHLESCASGTCQILTEGNYNGILEPWKHYIPVRPDLGNVDEVLELVRRDDLRRDITEQAYRDVVASGRYTYQSLVNTVMQRSLETPRAIERPRRRPLWNGAAFGWMQGLDGVDRLMAKAATRYVNPLRQRLLGR
ncbi:MAG: glycosyltransferase [Gemmatimonadetes bacterium]|nr:glycosyltransferase [Gemmatimonadota bacterium]